MVKNITLGTMQQGYLKTRGYNNVPGVHSIIPPEQHIIRVCRSSLAYFLQNMRPTIDMTLDIELNFPVRLSLRLRLKRQTEICPRQLKLYPCQLNVIPRDAARVIFGSPLRKICH